MSETATPITDVLRQEVEKDVRAIYEAKFAKEVADTKQQLTEQNTIAINQAIEEFKKSQQPPSQEEIAQLLNQEYLEFSVVVPWEGEAAVDGKRTFAIRELPQIVEKKFYAQFKNSILPKASELGALTFELLEGDVGKKITSLLETFEPTFDLMAEACVMILNPRGKEKELTKEWMQLNLSCYRQWNIIYAQVEVNRLRDFFSQLSRGSKGMTMNRGASTRS